MQQSLSIERGRHRNVMNTKETTMVRRGSKCFALHVTAYVCIVLLPGAAHAKGNPMTKRQLTEQLTITIAKVQTSGPSMARTEAAQHLAELTRRVDPKKVDDKTIGDLVSLLDTSEDSVRYWVATCLGYLGPRARIAIPKLQEILAEVDCLRASKTSAGAIRLALSRMGVKPPPLKCGTPRAE